MGQYDSKPSTAISSLKTGANSETKIKTQKTLDSGVLPQLTGTEKQVKFAEDIRSDFVGAMNTLMNLGEHEELFDDVGSIGSTASMVLDGFMSDKKYRSVLSDIDSAIDSFTFEKAQEIKARYTDKAAGKAAVKKAKAENIASAIRKHADVIQEACSQSSESKWWITRRGLMASDALYLMGSLAKAAKP